jgi:hypothetical protein
MDNKKEYSIVRLMNFMSIGQLRRLIGNIGLLHQQKLCTELQEASIDLSLSQTDITQAYRLVNFELIEQKKVKEAPVDKKIADFEPTVALVEEKAEVSINLQSSTDFLIGNREKVQLKKTGSRPNAELVKIFRENQKNKNQVSDKNNLVNKKAA